MGLLSDRMIIIKGKLNNNLLTRKLENKEKDKIKKLMHIKNQ